MHRHRLLAGVLATAMAHPADAAFTELDGNADDCIDRDEYRAALGKWFSGAAKR